MKTFLLLCSIVGCFCLADAAEPTAKRQWQAKTGQKVEAIALKVVNGRVHLKKADGNTVKVPLSILIKEDQELLEKHFGLSAGGVPKPEGSGAEAASGLPHPLGQVSGPVDAGGGSSYYVYLPKSLKQGRKAPLLFYTDAGGGRPNHIADLSEYAELFGWVLAVSVESKNAAGVGPNIKNCKNCLDHILRHLPVDTKRLHYTGNSGGGAMAFLNSGTRKAYGIMPNIGYIPQQTNERATVVYGLGGGADYNRYLTAYAAQKYKKNGFHRMNGGGHGGAPAEHRGDGMFWMHCKFLGKEKSRHEAEAKDFELSVLEWLGKLKESDPMRAYSNAVFLRDVYELKGANQRALASLLGELSKAPDNELYHEGLLAIDDLSGKHFAPLGKGGGSQFNHESSRASRAADKLREKFGHIKRLADVLDAIKKPTVGR